MSRGKRIPFQYMDFPSKKGHRKPFIEQVENVLEEDLQKPDVFGCKIIDCHTHAGSKIHFNDFIEAELLFHNNNYNRSFAQLTCDWVVDCYSDACAEKSKENVFENVLLIGYEKYSELYLQELNDIIEERIGIKCAYCVYETVAETQSDGSRKNKIDLRNFDKICDGKIILKSVADTWQENDNPKEKINEFAIENTLCVFIVPINTTLSTMDKMVAKFYQSALVGTAESQKTKATLDKLRREHICLITLCDISSYNSENNEYWEFYEEDYNWIRPISGGFEYLKDDYKIRNLVAIPSEWSLARNCTKCYPRLVEEEKPMFGVNRGSVVPMLRVGTAKTLTPIAIDQKEKSIKNLLKVCTLSECLLYGHTSRGENHYQYYLNTDKFIKNNRSDVETYLDSIKDTLLEQDGNIQIFDYLVAPRHESNAEWVHLVHKRVFNGAARIIYFDVEKEYRSNLKAKYSDLICGLMNIKESNQKFLVRFHFVDDTIQSGANFLRAKNLISSLSSDLENVKIFDCVFILVNRLSSDTRKFYSGDIKRFFYYADVNISPMRSYEDACTLCKLIADYHNIRSQCATNKLSEVCTSVIDRHRLSSFSSQQKADGKNTWRQQEKKLLFFITHLLNERLSNKLALEEIEKPFPIDSERSSKEIEALLLLYYNNGKNIISKYTLFDNIETLVWKIAFIKAISRPFFIYHIRQRQAAFTFCIRILNELLDADKSIKNCVLVQVLVKSLSDLNANYLLRCEILEKLISYAETGDNYYKDIDNKVSADSIEFYQKRLFRSESLLHYLKKDIVLSRDTTKSLLLEYVLLENDEIDFFDHGHQTNYSGLIEGFVADGSLTAKAILYLENNVILKNGLADTEAGNNLQKLQSSIVADSYLYFFSNLNDLWRLNTGEELKSSLEVLENYSLLTQQINNFDKQVHESRTDLSKFIDQLFESVNGKNAPKMQTIAFVYDHCESNSLFQFFTLAGNPAEGTEILEQCKFGDLKTSQAFFYDKNLDEIHSNLYETNGKKRDIFFIKDNLTVSEECSSEAPKKALIVRLGNNVIPDNFSNDAKSPDESIYLQIWGFDEKNIKHWFSLKLLLTLRESFVKLIDKINLQELVEERKIDAQKAALAIKKATTHAQCDKYYKLDFLHENSFQAEQFYNYYIKSGEKATEVLPILYDKYIQLLSDDFLASVYKKIINYQDCFKKSPAELGTLAKKIDNIWFGSSKLNRKEDVDYIRDLFASDLYVNKVINITLYRENTIRNVKFSVTIKLNILEHDWENRAILCWNGEISSDMSLVVLFVLMIVNAAEHGDGDAIEIVISDDGICFTNKMHSDSTATCKEIENQIEKNYSIPPWVMEKQHLTLWTLYHAKNIVKEGKGECITPQIEVLNDGEDLIYKIKIDIIRNI